MVHKPENPKKPKSRALQDIRKMTEEKRESPKGSVELLRRKERLADQIQKLDLPKSHPAFRAKTVKEFNKLLNKHPIRATIERP